MTVDPPAGLPTGDAGQAANAPTSSGEVVANVVVQQRGRPELASQSPLPPLPAGLRDGGGPQGAAGMVALRADEARRQTFAEVLRPKERPSSYGPHTLAALDGPASAAKTRALHTVHATLSGALLNSTLPTDELQRNAVTHGVHRAALDYADIARRLEDGLPRDGAQTGDDGDLGVARLLFAEAGKVLENLDTTLSIGLLSRLIGECGGVLVPVIAGNPALLGRLVDTTLALAKLRIAQTGGALARAWPLAGWEMPREIGGSYQALPGVLELMSAYTKGPDYPYDELPTKLGLLLGTDNAALVRDRVAVFLRHADQVFPIVQDLYRARFASNKEDPSDGTLTGQFDVWRLVVSLAWFTSEDGPGYSASHAFTCVAGLFEELLPQMQSPEMHRMLADNALVALERYAARGPKTADADEAARKLTARLSAPGADPAVSGDVAAYLARLS